MTLFILTETSAGYALLKAKDKKLLKRDDLEAQTATAEGVSNLMKLKSFHKFDSATAALEEAASLVEGKVTPQLASLLESIKGEKKASLAVADPKLANAVAKLPGLSITPIADSSTGDLFRAIRTHLPEIIPGLLPDDVKAMSLGLSHSLARHKLKFSPDKIDTMIVQAIALLDDLDKELNTYAMRVKEWYGWHFPELAKILNDNLVYARVVLKMGFRSNAESCDLSDVLPEELVDTVKTAADRSMGTDILDEDLENIQALAEEVVGFSEYRTQLANYLTSRMTAIAPNLTALVGELVGARLIAHAGSLVNLSKSPASTIQILGAEKALFRALKTKHDTPKYGLIYHASLVGQATGKNKGKMARVLAAKAALGLRIDALAEWALDENGHEPSEEEKGAVGMESRYQLEKKLALLEGKPLKPRGVHIAPDGQPGKFELRESRKYNTDADALDTAAEAKKIKDVEMKDADDEESEAESSSESPSSSSSSSSSLSSEEEDPNSIEAMAKKAGLPVARYQRKLERGEITFDKNGNPVVISKKDLKKAKKEEEKKKKKKKKESSSDKKDIKEEKADDKKRKRDDDAGEKSEKKKKTKKSKL
ncbi:Nucleolar protein 58 [Ascosphaera aggregata]|nr:Nucleolar protein 58 [Ascosphaera aggregata]